MIDTLWAERIGRHGVIDCDFDLATRTIVAGDIDGWVVMLDSKGNSLDRHQVDLPVWGVSQCYRDSTHMVAVAGADKERKLGRGYLLSDFQQTAEFDADGELWDCAFTQSGACFTSWSSKVYVTDHGGGVVQKIGTPGVPYGLEVSGDRVAVALSDVGVGNLHSNGSGLALSVERRFPDACYNLCRSAKSDLIVTGSKSGSAAMLSSLTQQRNLGGGDVCAVAIEADFLLAGSMDGKVALFHLGAFAEALATLTLPGAIWNISLDGDSGLAYVACGDGNLYCLQFDLTEVTSEELAEIRSAVRAPVEIERLLGASSSAAIEITLGVIEQEWDRWSETDVAAIARVCRTWLDSHETPRLHYVLGLAEMELGDSDEAILLFQHIEGDSEYGLKSLLPLGRALQMNGSIGAAIRVLRMHLPRVPDAMRTEYLFEIGRLHEEHGDDENALDAYELVSILDHDFPGLRDSLERLRAKRPDDEPTASTDLSADLLKPSEPNEHLSARRTAEYDTISYFLYEYGSPDEEAKKHMETDLMARMIIRTGSSGRSLDIGCATGRWPEWFARKGFEAHGYDISSASIEICRQRALKNPQLSLAFDQYDIAEGARLPSYFDVVTCMMGTFNHIPAEVRASFLHGVRESLTAEGRFVASVWNVSSPFCEFLGLDGQHAKEALRRNSLGQEEFLKELISSGFEVEGVIPFCFLPNECYRVWDDEFRGGIDGLIGIENHLRVSLTGHTRSQMNFVVARAGR